MAAWASLGFVVFSAEYKKVVEMDPSCRVAKDKIPGLERECAKRMEKLKEETLGETATCPS